MARRNLLLVPLLVGVCAVGLFFGELLAPGAVLAARDVPFLHLPLRVDLLALIREGGLPQWNPWIHGGEPVLSNPHYAVFYPATWLILLAPPHYALGLALVLHALLAFVGAWKLAQRLGCDPLPALLAAMGFVAGGTLLPLGGTPNLFFATAWWPWAVRWGLEGLAEEDRFRRGRSAVLAALAMAAQLLAGSPAVVVMSALALLVLGFTTVTAPGRVFWRWLVLIAAAGLLAAVQLVPTWFRVLDSPRAGGLPRESASEWSTPPERLVELAFPRFYGDPERDEEGLYFGWGIHDKDYPLLLSIYPGMLLAVLGLAALLVPSTALRKGWGVVGAAGLLLALGRHAPIFGVVAGLPLFDAIRYPEKFFLLTLCSLVFAGALGWQELGRPAGGRRPRGPLVVGGALLAAASALLGVVVTRSGWVETFVREHSGLPPSPGALAAAVAYLRQQAITSVLLVAAVLLLLVAVRRRRLSEGVLGTLALLLLGGDLWLYGHRFDRVLPAAEVLAPPELARPLIGRDERIFTDVGVTEAPEVQLRVGEPGFQQILTRMARLDPYSGNLWALSYALNEDYDQMMTGWARHALALLHESWSDPAASRRLLGAWGVGTLVRRSSPEELLAGLRRLGRPPPPARLESNPERLDRLRLVPRVTFHATLDEAVEGVRVQGFDVRSQDHWVGSPLASGEVAPAAGVPRLLKAEERSARVEVTYQAPGRAYLVFASTFDGGWQARVDGQLHPTFPTALGELGVALPAGRHRLSLAYRDPWVGVGGPLSLAALLACGLLLLRRWRLG